MIDKNPVDDKSPTIKLLVPHYHIAFWPFINFLASREPSAKRIEYPIFR